METIIEKAKLHGYNVILGSKPKSGEKLNYIFITKNKKTIKSFHDFDREKLIIQVNDWLRFMALKKIY